VGHVCEKLRLDAADLFELAGALVRELLLHDHVREGVRLLHDHLPDGAVTDNKTGDAVLNQ